MTHAPDKPNMRTQSTVPRTGAAKPACAPSSGTSRSYRAHAAGALLSNPRKLLGPPPKQGLYDPRFEHDACGVGFLVNIKGRKSHQLVRQALNILVNLNHLGACGC